MSLATEIVIKGRVDTSLTRAVQAVNTRLASSGTAATKATTQTTRATTALSQATTRLSRSTRAATRSVTRWDAESGRATTGLTRLTSRAREATRAMRGLGQESKAAGVGDMVTAIGSGGALKRGLTASLTTEAAQIRLSTAINATDKDQAIKDVTASANRMALSAPIDKTQVYDVNYALNSAGLKADVAVKGAESVLKVAKVTNGAAEQVGEVMATTYNNLGQSMGGDELTKMARIGDMMTKVQLKYQIRDFGQLGEGMAYAASTAASAKVPLQDLLMAIGQLNSAGVSGSRAGTSFVAVMRSMSKAARQLGFDIVRDDKGQMDYLATMSALNEALSQYDDIDERNQKIQDIFGDEGKAGLIPLLQALGQARADQAEIANSIGLTDQEFAKFVASHGGRLTVIINAVTMVGEAIGNSLLPAIDLVEQPIVSLAGHMTTLITEFPRLGQAIGVVMAALGAAAGMRLLKGGLNLLRGRGGAAAAVAGGAVPVRVVGGSGGGLGSLFDGLGGGGKTGKVGRVGRFLGRFGKLGKVGRVVGTVGRVAGRLGGGALTALSYAPDVIDGIATGNGAETGKGLGGAGGALAGAMAGAALGSVVPVVGTAIGGVVGGILGSMGGENLGQWIGGMFDDTKPAEEMKSQPQQVTNNITTTNNITQQPGQDPEALARAIAKRNAEQARGAMYDAD